MPIVLDAKALLPTATLYVPVVLLLNAQKPTAVLLEDVLANKALDPKAVLLIPT